MLAVVLLSLSLTFGVLIEASSGQSQDITVPHGIRAEREKGWPVTYYFPKDVPSKTPGGAVGSLLGATSWKIYPVAAFAATKTKEGKILGLRIDFSSYHTSIYPEAIWFLVDDRDLFQRRVSYGEITTRSRYTSCTLSTCEAYRIEWTGADIERLLSRLQHADKAAMTVFDTRLDGGRISMTFGKKELVSFAPLLEFYANMPGQVLDGGEVGNTRAVGASAASPTLAAKPNASDGKNAAQQQSQGSEAVPPRRASSANYVPQLGIEAAPHGENVEIIAVEPMGLAEAANLHPGDLIVSVDDQRIATPSDLSTRLAAKASGSQVTLGYMFRSSALGYFGKQLVITLK